MRPLWLDDGLPGDLAMELQRRGREAHSLAALGLASAGDAAVLEAVAAAGAVLVTTIPLPGGTVAVVAPHDSAGRRDAVHRWAHAMASQRSGSVRRYPR